jgi:hypothetical protein
MDGWMDERRTGGWYMNPYTKDSRCSVFNIYLIVDEFSLYIMASIYNDSNKRGTGVDIVPGGCNGCVQVIDKGINKPCNQYITEEFEHWEK